MIIGLLVAVPANFVIWLFVDPRLALLTPFAIVMFALAGLAGSGVGRRWVYNSINLLGPSRASTLRATSPVLTALAAMALYGEAVTAQRWLGIVAIVVGGVLVSYVPGQGRKGWASMGVLYALGSAISYAFRPLFLKLGLDVADAPLAAATLGSVAALVYSLAMEDRATWRIQRFGRAELFFFLGGVCQVAAQLGLTYGIADGEVSQVYAITASAPLFAVLFTAVLLRGVERVTPRLVLGALLVVAGVISI